MSKSKKISAEDDEAIDRRSRIVKGAREAFLRFGFERTNLADIATSAGVSRTAPYHYFSSKEDVLRAVVENAHAKSLQLATVALNESVTLDAALAGLFEAKFGRMLVALAASPHSSELADATHRVTGSATRAADEAFAELVVSALKRHGAEDDAKGVADTLIAAVTGLMRANGGHVTKAEFDERLMRLLSWIRH